MNTARRQQISKSSKERWQQCEQLALILECDKQLVHDKLLSRIKNQNLLEKLLLHDKESIDLVRSWILPMRIHKPDEESDQTGLSELKLALWFIGKCRSVKAANRAFQAAISAARKL